MGAASVGQQLESRGISARWGGEQAMSWWLLFPMDLRYLQHTASETWTRGAVLPDRRNFRQGAAPMPHSATPVRAPHDLTLRACRPQHVQQHVLRHIFHCRFVQDWDHSARLDLPGPRTL
jgi:hypothetical protein